MARGSVNQVVQIGVESVPNTPVACNKKFPSLQVSLKPAIETRFYRATGAKVPSVGVLNQVSSEASFNGGMTYSELLYLFASYLTLVSSTQIGSTPGYTHLLQPAAPGVAETFKTYTLQKGDATAAQQVANLIINNLQLSISRQECTVSGGGIATAINNSATLTSSPTMLENVPVSGAVWSAYLDSTFANIGVTKITDGFKASVTFPEKYKPKWVLDAAQGSWKEAVEVATEPTVTLTAEFNSQMRGIYDAMFAASLPTYYLRLKGVGANIGTAADYTVQMDFAIKAKEPSPEDDIDGIVFGYNFGFEIVDDSTMGRPYSITLVNRLTSL